MRALSSHSRRFGIAGAALLAIVAGAYGLGRVYPPEGPSAGTIARAQNYVEGIADGQIPTRGRYVLVDAASAKLFMIENGHVRDIMRVIVGKPAAATPALKSVIHFATINPYWHVPTDLARTIVAPHVLKDGPAYLAERGYEVVSKFGADAQVLPPASVDWAAVAAGQATVLVRQRPGPANSMGRLKFQLADGGGIYLHDTPKKELFAQADRSLSNGCVRLEDAPRFARWLIGTDAPLGSAAPEQHVAVPGAMPITIAYLDSRAQMQLAGLQ